MNTKGQKRQIYYSQAIHTWMFGPMELEEAAAAIARTGAECVDLSVTLKGEHNRVDRLLRRDIAGLLDNHGLRTAIVTPMFMLQQLDLSAPDEDTRKTALNFAMQGVDLTAAAGAGKMLVSPSLVSVNHRLHCSYKADWEQAVKSLRLLAEYARPVGVTLLIEPINRYRVGLVHTVAEALRMAEDVAMANISVVADTYHMHMEEKLGVADTLQEQGGRLGCLHVGDSNRMPPGFGAMDWRAILLALAKSGFEGVLSHEPIWLYFDENCVATDLEYRELFVGQLSRSVEFLRDCMRAVNMVLSV